MPICHPLQWLSRFADDPADLADLAPGRQFHTDRYLQCIRYLYSEYLWCDYLVKHGHNASLPPYPAYLSDPRSYPWVNVIRMDINSATHGIVYFADSTIPDSRAGGYDIYLDATGRPVADYRRVAR